MTTTFIKTLIILSILLYSCNNNSADTVAEMQTPDFLKKYKMTTLPLTMKGCLGNTYYLPLINPDSLRSDNDGGFVKYCTFKTNGDYYAVINVGLADCILPSLTTYDKNGKVIDDVWLGIGWCGAEPGFSCEEFTTIRKDFTIYSSDTISSVDFDSLGKEIESTRQHYIMYKKGRLLSSGKIEFTDTLRQTLEK